MATPKQTKATATDEQQLVEDKDKVQDGTSAVQPTDEVSAPATESAPVQNDSDEKEEPVEADSAESGDDDDDEDESESSSDSDEELFAVRFLRTVHHLNIAGRDLIEEHQVKAFHKGEDLAVPENIAHELVDRRIAVPISSVGTTNPDEVGTRKSIERQNKFRNK